MRTFRGAEVRLDRRGWLRERASVFQRPMQVAAEDVIVYQAPDRAQVIATVRRTQRRRTTTSVVALVFARGQLVYEELVPPRAVPPVPAPPPDGFGYDRAPTIAAMRAAPIAGGDALVARVAALPAIEVTLTGTSLDPVTGLIGAARAVGRLAPGDPRAAIAGQSIVVLDRAMREVCRGTLGAVTARAAGLLDEPVAPDRAAAAVWARGDLVIAARVEAPCTGAFVRGPDAAPITFAITHDREIALRTLQAYARALGESGADVEVSAELGSPREGFALFTLTRGPSCDGGPVAARVLYRAQLTRRTWDLTRIADLGGTDPSMLITDLDRDGTLDAIVAGAAWVGGRLDVREPLAVPRWPGGLGCRL